jgi:hypothetical protein
LFADAVVYWHLPETRAKNCRYEYLRYQYAFKTLIEPYVDHALVEKLNPKRLLNFGPGAWFCIRDLCFATHGDSAFWFAARDLARVGLVVDLIET